MKIFLSKKFRIGISISLLLFILSSVLSYFSIRELVRHNKRIDRTNEVLKRLEEFESQIKDVETANRGYALTNDETFLKPYMGTYLKISKTYNDLRTFTETNPQQKARLDTLKLLFEEKYSRSDARIKLQQSGKLAAREIDPASFYRGNYIMSEIKRIVEVMKQEETRLLNLYSANARFSAVQAPVFIIIASILALGITLSIIYIINEDTRKLVETQKLLLEEEEKFRSLLESAPDAMIITDSKGEIVLVNTQTERLFGYEAKEIVGKKVETLIPQHFHEVHLNNRDKSTSEIKPRLMGSDMDLAARRKDGSIFPVEISFSPLNTKEGLLISVALRDISDRKRIDAELREAKEKAERATAFKSRYIANLSHELRTPIHAIAGFAEVLKKKTHSKEEKEYLNYIITSGNILLKLIGDILDLSKIEEGKMEVVNEPFEINALLKSTLLPFKKRTQQKGLSFYIAIDEKIPPFVVGDPQKIIQILVNLIGNALKFTKEGYIKVSFELVAQNGETGEADVLVAVEDTGIGIPADKQEVIFQTYTQGNSFVKKDFGGAGLGLSIVKELVQLLGSDIKVISPSNTSSDIDGAGSKFLFPLKLKIPKDLKEKKALDKEEDRQPLIKNGVKVLMAEDNEVLQKLGKIILENLGCETHVANNGEEALQLIEKNEYSIVFMDVQMPILDGITATRIIREKYQDKLPVIGLTANVSKEAIEECKRAGMNDFLGKPFTEDQLLSKINTYGKSTLSSKSSSSGYTNIQMVKDLSNGDYKFIREVILTYFRQTDDLLHNMAAWIRDGEFEKINSAVHKFFSTASAIGNDALLELLIKIQKNLTENKNLDSVPDLLNSLKNICEASNQELKAELEKLKSLN